MYLSFKTFSFIYLISRVIRCYWW